MDDEEFEPIEPTAQGIIDCLRMLIDEAGILNLSRTSRSLQAAVAECLAEQTMGDTEAVSVTHYPHAILH